MFGCFGGDLLSLHFDKSLWCHSSFGCFSGNLLLHVLLKCRHLLRRHPGRSVHFVVSAVRRFESRDM